MALAGHPTLAAIPIQPPGLVPPVRQLGPGQVAAIQLVLAALLATDGAAGRVLVLDELGDSLGDVNRKQVLAAIDQVARAQGVTILGTCQDSVIYDAAGVCGQILWFEHTARTDAYNHPTRTWGFDPDKGRVEILAPWLRAGRDG
jgi:hypothetical protein